jgi:sugar fermentation stimulation protein A
LEAINSNPPGLAWPPLVSGILLKRYKRFLADVQLFNGQVVTAHCTNTGSMQACSQPGCKVYLSVHDDARRKLKYTWQMIRMPTSLVGVNTLVPNRLVAQAIGQGRVPGLDTYDRLRREVRVGAHSRLDLMLTREPRERCFVEIKNCTLVSKGVARFPDAVTVRGRKHLIELRKLADSGDRAVMFFLIQRTDACIFRPAEHIDEAYAQELRRSMAAGVEVMAYDVHIDMEHIALNRSIPCEV